MEPPHSDSHDDNNNSNNNNTRFTTDHNNNSNSNNTGSDDELTLSGKTNTKKNMAIRHKNNNNKNDIRSNEYSFPGNMNENIGAEDVRDAPFSEGIDLLAMGGPELTDREKQDYEDSDEDNIHTATNESRNSNKDRAPNNSKFNTATSSSYPTSKSANTLQEADNDSLFDDEGSYELATEPSTNNNDKNKRKTKSSKRKRALNPQKESSKGKPSKTAKITKQSTQSKVSSTPSSSSSTSKSFQCGVTCIQGKEAFKTNKLDSILSHMEKKHGIQGKVDIVRHLHSIPESCSSRNRTIKCCSDWLCDGHPVLSPEGFVQHFNAKHSQSHNIQISVDDVKDFDGLYYDINLDRQSFIDNNDNTTANEHGLTNPPQHSYNLRSRSGTHHLDTLAEEYNGMEDEDEDDDNETDETFVPDRGDAMSLDGETEKKREIDYFEEDQLDGSICKHAIQIGAIKGESLSNIRELLRYTQDDLHDHLCGVNHPRINTVHHKHVEIFRNLNNLLLRTILSTIEQDTSSDDNSSTSSSNTASGTNNNNNNNTTPSNTNTDNNNNNASSPLNDKELCSSASIAQFLLPTIYLMLKRSKRSRGQITQKAYLQELEDLSVSDLIGCILHLYNIGRAKLKRDDPPHRTPNAKVIQKKVRQLVVDEGHVSRGMNYLCRYADTDGVEAPPYLTQHEFKAKVESLHPPSDETYDNIHNPEDTDLIENALSNDITLSASVLNTTLRKLKRDSTPGWDGWTFQLMRQLYEENEVDDDNVSENGALLINFIKHGLKGKLPLRSLWNVSKIILIPEWKAEKHAWKHRPIAIGTSWYRLLGKAALNIIGDSVGRQLQPYQFAVGIPDGIGIAATILQDFQEKDGHAILSIDLSNAFNSLRRGRIYDGLKKYAPQLLPFFQWSYTGKTELRSSNGILMGHAATGTRQGDPLSMLYFAVGIHPLIEQLSGITTTLHPENFLQSYADDISLCIRDQDVPAAWDAVAEVFPIGSETDGIVNDRAEDFVKIGIAVNPSKCFAILHPASRGITVEYSNNSHQPSTTNKAVTLAEFHTPEFITSDNAGGHLLRTVHHAKIFGVMIGDIAARTDFSTKLYKEIEKKASFILSFCGAKAGFALVKYCLNSIANYLHRIEDEANLDLLHHDQIISRTIASLMGRNQLTPVQECLRGLPHKLSGLGILHHNGPLTRINHDDLQKRTRSWLEHRGLAPPDEAMIEITPPLESDSNTTPPPRVHLGLGKVLSTFPDLEKDETKLKEDLGFEQGTRDGTSAQQRKYKLHKLRWTKLIADLKNQTTTIGDALWVDASAFNGSGDILLCGSHHARWFNDEDFKSLIETKLLMNPVFDKHQGEHIETICRGCSLTQHQHPMTAKKYHYLNCRVNSRLRIQRHDIIKSHLGKMLLKVLPQDNADITISNEQHTSLDDAKRSDVTIEWANDTKTHFDVGITSPISNMLVSRMAIRKGAINSLAAASETHDDKLRKYQNATGQFYPIIFLATGRPSKQLSNVCKELQQRSHLDEQSFMKYWREFLRNSMRTCLKFVARTSLDRPQLDQHIKNDSSKRKQSRRQTNRRLKDTIDREHTMGNPKRVMRVTEQVEMIDDNNNNNNHNTNNNNNTNNNQNINENDTNQQITDTHPNISEQSVTSSPPAVLNIDSSGGDDNFG